MFFTRHLRCTLRWFTVCVLTMALVPFSLWSQDLGDSLELNYDSIQDVRTNLLERQIQRQMNRLEGDQLENRKSIDSLGLVMEDLMGLLELLEQEKLQQSEHLSLLQEEIDHTRESSHAYRKGLHRILWIAGSVMLILLTASFLVLLLYSLKTRSLLDRLKWNQNRLRRRVKKQKAEIQETREAVRTRKKEVQKTIRKEIRKRLKALRIKKK